MLWTRRITLLLLGAVIVGSCFTTEDLRPMRATPVAAQSAAVPQPAASDLTRIKAMIARNKNILAQHRTDLDQLRVLAGALQRRADSGRAWWPHDVQPDGPFCTMLGGFAAAVGRDRDAGASLQATLQTLDPIPDAPLIAVMQAIILDLYSDAHLTPGLAQQVTETLCRQGIPPQY